jgi:DNA-binding PadR family transcriptional regulator
MGEDTSKSISMNDTRLRNGCSIYRGQLRLALLRCLMDGDMHGLDMINRIKEVTSGEWIPSPGSVYPILQDFEKDHLVQKKQKGRTLIYTLTDKGKDSLRAMYIEVKQQLHFMDWIMKIEE